MTIDEMIAVLEAARPREFFIDKDADPSAKNGYYFGIARTQPFHGFTARECVKVREVLE